MTKDYSENSIKISKSEVRKKGGVVVLGLDEWREIEKIIEDREDALHYERARKAKDNQKLTSFNEVKKKLDLQ